MTHFSLRPPQKTMWQGTQKHHYKYYIPVISGTLIRLEEFEILKSCQESVLIIIATK